MDLVSLENYSKEGGMQKPSDQESAAVSSPKESFGDPFN
jgi:hypothetical protein